MEWAQQHALHWTQHYGYHAVVPALLIDPAGIPWAWIALMLLAGEAGKSVPLMLLYGFAVLSVFDHALFWIGVKGGQPLLDKLSRRSPKIAAAVASACCGMRDNAAITIACGRFLPFVGRWVGLSAALANVPYGRFSFYNAIGGGFTVVGFGLAAHWIGREALNQPWFGAAAGAAMIVLTVMGLGGAVWKARRERSSRTE